MKNKPSLYVDNEWLHFDFWCNKNIHQIKIYSEKDVIVQCGLLRNGTIDVLIWTGNDRHLIVQQTVPYIEGQHYSIKYLFGYTTRVIKFESFMTQYHTIPICTYVGPKSNKEVEFYKCEKYLHPREAKKLWKYINKRKLVSKAIWDPELEMYDWKCKACNYSWVSNPDIGYVRKFEDDPENAKRCPVCEDLYQIMQSGWRPLTPIQRFKEWYRWWSEYQMFKKNK